MPGFSRLYFSTFSSVRSFKIPLREGVGFPSAAAAASRSETLCTYALDTESKSAALAFFMWRKASLVVPLGRPPSGFGGGGGGGSSAAAAPGAQ